MSIEEELLALMLSSARRLTKNLAGKTKVS